MMNYASSIDPKSTPTHVVSLNQANTAAGPKFSPKVNPAPPGYDPLVPDTDLPPVPEYKPYKEPLQQSPVFHELHKLFSERIAYIDGAMGTMIQRYKLQVGRAAEMHYCVRCCNEKESGALYCRQLKCSRRVRACRYSYFHGIRHCPPFASHRLQARNEK